MNNFYRSTAPFLTVVLLVGLVTSVHWTPGDSDSDKFASAQEEQLEERSVQARTRLHFKVEAVRELIDGRCSLAQTSAQLRELLEPQCVPPLQKCFPANTVDQSLALQIIANIRALPMEPEQKAEVLGRLEKELAEMKHQSSPWSN